MIKKKLPYLYVAQKLMLIISLILLAFCIIIMSMLNLLHKDDKLPFTSVNLTNTVINLKL